jgi:hypothetical protein
MNWLSGQEYNFNLWLTLVLMTLAGIFLLLLANLIKSYLNHRELIEVLRGLATQRCEEKGKKGDDEK